MNVKNVSACVLLTFICGEATSVKPPALAGEKAASEAVDDPLATFSEGLSKDPAEVFAWVRDNIKYECYHGSLRGPVGTYWARGGNSLDQSDLLAALLRRARRRCRIVRGQLPEEDAQDLILSMFPSGESEVDIAKSLETDPKAAALLKKLVPNGDLSRALGDLPKSQPHKDPEMLAEARDHFWVEVQQQGKWVPLDPSMPNAQVGRAACPTQSVFEEIPADLKHSLGLRIEAEVGTDQATEQKTLVGLELPTSDFVGSAVRLHHDRFEGRLGVAHQAVVSIGDQRFVGKRVYEVAPSGAKLLSERLVFEVKPPAQVTQSHEFIVLDRREDKSRDEILGRKHTFVIAPGLLGPEALKDKRFSQAKEEAAQKDRTGPTLPFIGRLPSPREVRSGKSDSERQMSDFVMQECLGRTILATCDAETRRAADRLGAVMYAVNPRVVAVSTGSITADCICVDSRPVVRPGQLASVGQALRALSGMQADVAQTRVLEKAVGKPPVSATSVLSAAANQNIPIRHWGQRNIRDLDASGLSDSSKEQIREAVANGEVAIWPERSVALADGTFEGGFMVDPSSGRSRGNVTGQPQGAKVETPRAIVARLFVESALRGATFAFAADSALDAAFGPDLEPGSVMSKHPSAILLYRVVQVPLAYQGVVDTFDPDVNPHNSALEGSVIFLLLTLCTTL